MNTNRKLGHNPTWEQIRNRIDEDVDKTNGCWEWLGLKYSNGYGRFNGTSSHRLSYESHIGPIFKGMDIDHLCRNRACCNPDHLEPVTRQENLRRGVGIELQKAKAAKRKICSNGHAMAPENTYIRPSDGSRQCKTCRAASEIEYANSNREEINKRKREWRKKWKLLGIRK